MDNKTSKRHIFRFRYFISGAAIIFALLNMGNTFPSDEKNDIGIPLKNVKSVTVDDNNIKWFITDGGIVSFDGEKWKLHNENKNLPSQELSDLTISSDTEGAKLWITSTQGASVAPLPIDSETDVTTYSSENATILSNNVVSVTTGKNSIRWFGTDKGVSALSSDKWLTPDYDMYYPEMMFDVFPITSMATNLNGDSLYVGTDGAGVARVYRDDVDGISGASVYAIWGPIDLPSDNIQSIYIAPDGTEWFGTDLGIAKHTGSNTLENWTVFTSDDGLVNDFVQTITGDKNGNIWFGTKGGISVFNGSEWTSYTTDNGLISNNILSFAVDKNGSVWIGTDVGISCYKDGEFLNF
jgi:ligand-binding sensor domain-containing protein